MFSYLRNIFEPENNAVRITKLLADHLKVKITLKSLTRDILEHPDYPSLLSISDVLDSYGIDNLPISLDSDKLTADTAPFITLIKGDDQPIFLFTIVREIRNNLVSFYDPEKYKWTECSMNDFTKRYSNTILIADPENPELAGEKEYNKIHQKENSERFLKYFLPFILPCIFIASGVIDLVRAGPGTLPSFFFSLLTLGGVAVGSLLLWYEFDQYNPALRQFCSIGNNVNCNAILQSKASKILGISWSTIGLSFFTGQFLLFLFTGIHNTSTLWIIGWLSMFTLPYVIFSIFYQWKIAGQWCMLCLLIQAVLVLQFTVAVAGNWPFLIKINYPMLPGLILSTLSALLLPFAAITFLAPIMQKAKDGQNGKDELQRFKRNPEVFESLLSKERLITESPDGLGVILGNANAPYRLIKVCNPYCGPCSKAHPLIDKILQNNKNVQVQIIFTSTNNEKDSRSYPVKHFLAIAAKGDEELIKRAMDDWYLDNNKDYEIFAAKYPMTGELQQQEAKINAMNNWCKKEGIKLTPTFFLSVSNISNGENEKFHQLPSTYNISDLPSLLSILRHPKE